MLTRHVIIAAAWATTIAATVGEAPALRPPGNLSGDWRSEPRVKGRPDVQIILAVESAATARMVLRGESQNVSEWATLTTANIAWDGRRLAFTTALPHDEGTAYWTLTPNGQNDARLTATTEDFEPGDELPQWDLRKQRD